MKKIMMLSVLALASSGLAANCKKGKPCGGSCIPVSSTCHVGAPTPVRPTLPITPSVPLPAPQSIARVWTPAYGNCADARAAGHINMLTSNPNYHPDLDRDTDGIACEAGDDHGAFVLGWTLPTQKPSQPTSPRIMTPTGLKPYRVVKADGRLLTLNADYKDQQMFLAGVEAAPGQDGVLNAWIRRTFPVGSIVLGEVEKPGVPVQSIYFWQNGQMLNTVPIAEGFGLVSAMAAPRYLPYLLSVQEGAKAASKGTWKK